MGWEDWGKQSIQPLSADDLGTQALQTPDMLGSIGVKTGLDGFLADRGWGGTDSLFSGGSIFGSTAANGVKTQGWGGTALGVANGISNAWMGMQQYGLAKDQLAQSKKQFELNYGAQQKTTNAALSDRQAARVASNPGAYQSVADYMKTNGI